LQIVEGPITGPVIIRTDSRLYGVVTGDVTVPRGVFLELEGVVTGNLLACPGSRVVIHGEVAGRLFNEDSSVTVYGEIGSLWEEEEGATYLAPCAIVRHARERRRVS
jgi:cytoskeletal protein CcmA (bactofilin family)